VSTLAYLSYRQESCMAVPHCFVPATMSDIKVHQVTEYTEAINATSTIVVTDPSPG
jgi:hypothetical protein